jgi:hypothetical protein
MFMDTMWRGGGPYHGNANKIRPGNYNGDWQGAGKEMMHFAFDRHAGGIQGVFLWTTRCGTCLSRDYGV